MAHHLTESEPVSTMPSWPPLWFHLFHPSPASSPQPHGSLFLENSCTIQPQGLCTVSSICTALTRCLQAFHRVISSVLERGLPQTPDIRQHPLHTHTHTRMAIPTSLPVCLVSSMVLIANWHIHLCSSSLCLLPPENKRLEGQHLFCSQRVPSAESSAQHSVLRKCLLSEWVHSVKHLTAIKKGWSRSLLSHPARFSTLRIHTAEWKEQVSEPKAQYDATYRGKSMKVCKKPERIQITLFFFFKED